jgi:hypothetical protein
VRPEISGALQVAAPNPGSVSSPPFFTYTVFVDWSSASRLGPLPTMTLCAGWPHPDVWWRYRASR